MNTVFETKPIRRGRRAENEKIHEFLERDGRAEAAPIREWIEHWYDQLPSDKQGRIRERMRCGARHQFTSAYFELQMFAMLRRMGYDITVEPRLAGGQYNPDFLARRDAEAFYVEATVCGYGAGGLQGTTNEDDAVEKIRAAFKDEEVEIHSNLWLHAEGVLERTLSKKEVAKPFIDLMKRTTATEVRRCYESRGWHYAQRTRCREVVESALWRLEGVLEPKPHEDATGDVWGPSRSAMGDASKAMRTSLTKKARRWSRMGPSNGSIVVAMATCHSQYYRDTDQETRAIAEDSMSSKPTVPWRHELNAINGILFVGDISLGMEQGTRAKLIPNPERCLPVGVAPLRREHRLADLTGFPAHPHGHRAGGPELVLP